MELITYYLEMLSPLLLKGKPEVTDFLVQEVKIPQFEFNKYLYILVLVRLNRLLNNILFDIFN